MKKCIVIYIDGSKSSEAAVRELCAGIEEEGVKFEILVADENSALNGNYGRLAAWESSLGCGIGIHGGRAELWLSNHGTAILCAEVMEQMRKLGLNAARSLKKLPYIL